MHTKIVALASLAALAVAVAVGAACGSSSGNKTADGQIDTNPIAALARAASGDAQEMTAHADAMSAAAAQRPDHAHWAADAETIRANARMLSFMADGARSIARDRGSRPNNAVELTRVYGDGTNLHQMGQMLVDHGAAMTTHIAVMREEAAGDAGLLSVIAAYTPNVEAMKADGQAAIDRGTQLMQDARRLADSVGIDLQSGGEHDVP